MKTSKSNEAQAIMDGQTDKVSYRADVEQSWKKKISKKSKKI